MSQSQPLFATIVIDGPDRNLLNPEVMANVGADLRAAEVDSSVDGIIVTGAGNDFCGGLDLASIRAGGDPIEFARSLADLLKIFPRLTKPVTSELLRLTSRLEATRSQWASGQWWRRCR